MNNLMDFRIRPSSKRSQQERTEKSLVEFPIPKSFQGNQEMRSYNIRLQNLESNFSNYQDLWRRERDISNAGYLQVQKRLDMLEYKTFTNEKDIKKHAQTRVDNNDGLALSDNLKAYTNSEINSIKQTVLQQRQSHREYAKHQNQLIEQMSRKQMRLESEIRQLVSRQRDDYDQRISQQMQELRNNDSIKQQKIDNQYELMKSLMSNAEKKIFAEFDRKIRNETVIKDYLEDKLAELREQMAAEQRGIISKQSKFIREIKESIESIFAIIKNTQKQLTEQLNETQKIAANNFKRLSMTIETMKQQLSDQIAQINEETNQIQNQFVDYKNLINTKVEEQRETLIQIQQQNEEKMAESRHSQSSNGGNGGNGGNQRGNLQKQFTNWKIATEQKNLNVFKEISNTLKTMKIEWKKENDEISAEVGSFKQSLTNVKKSVPLEIKKSVQTVITIFNSQFDMLAQELDTITEMIALAKREIQASYKNEIKNSQAAILKEVKQMIKDFEKQQTLVFEKKMTKQEESLKAHTEQENRFLKELLVQKHLSLESQMNMVSQSNKKQNLITTSQLQDFTLKIKSFNQNYKDYLEEQRKDDMKKRIELEDSMRKNSGNLMDICYKKCEFLVDGMKKAIEMNIMKERAGQSREVELLREQNEKQIFQTKQDMLHEVNEKLDKLASERESNEEVMHEAFDQQLQTMKKVLSNEIGNSKLELTEKVNELIETVNELQQKGSQSTDQLESSMQSLKEAVWKIEAMSFSEQAKNKALIDRVCEDLNEVSENMAALAREMKSK